MPFETMSWGGHLSTQKNVHHVLLLHWILFCFAFGWLHFLHWVQFFALGSNVYMIFALICCACNFPFSLDCNFVCLPFCVCNLLCLYFSMSLNFSSQGAGPDLHIKVPWLAMMEMIPAMLNNLKPVTSESSRSQRPKPSMFTNCRETSDQALGLVTSRCMPS